MAAGETDVEFESRRYTPGVQDAVFVVGTLAVAGWLAVDATRGPVFGWGMTRLDWLTAFAVVVLVATVVPLIRDPARLRETLGAYPRRPLPVAAALATLVLIAVGIVGPLVVSRPVVDFQPTDQPPFGFAVPTAVSGSCVGRVVDGMCRGSLAHPLGTTKGGTDVFTWLLYGSRTTVQFAFTAVAVVAPVGALAGVTAGYVGGRWDALVTAVADLQQTVPTVIVYFFVATATDPSLFTLVVVYGVFDWGGIARVVRTRTVTERETAYVEAARNAGAGPLYIVRNHLLPNVAPAVVTTVSLLIP
ncbi:MAG: ABC transporter permease, partial [Halobaculum sp.]